MFGAVTQARTKVDGTDRWLLGVGVGLAVAGLLIAILMTLAVPVLGLVLLVPMLLAAAVSGGRVLLRKQPAAEALTTLRDAVIVFLAIGVLSMVAGMTVYHRTDVTYLGSVVTQRGTIRVADCDEGPIFGLHGYGRTATCHGKVTWADGPSEQVRLNGLGRPDVGKSVPVARERLLTGTLVVTRDDGHPWLLAGLLLGTPLLLLALWLLVLMPSVVIRPVRSDPVRRLRQRREEAEEYQASRAEARIRRKRGKVGFAQMRKVPGWVVTGDLRRLRVVAVLLIVGGLVVYGVRGTPELPGRAGLGITIGALGGLLLVIVAQRIERRRREAARIAEYGPDAADAIDAARDRARRPRPLLSSSLATILGIVGLAQIRPVVNAVTSGADGGMVVTMALPALGLLTAAILLLVPASDDDRGWRRLMCTSVRASLPDLPDELRPALTERELYLVDNPY
ncbi:hypothetical protein EV186_103147 [Labedaea rhizosphaerae]|uniref:Uncharacterized protein n=1 Tax=Labedaea rhizosphaerae TaxID=598644 RepID=A0A4R6SDJ7_LABRH|nr:hypothetical protein EV186_103147 [Labedaea rhizosphaerae]